MPAAFTTLPHFSLSLFSFEPEWASLIAAGSNPSESSRCFTSGSATAFSISRVEQQNNFRRCAGRCEDPDPELDRDVGKASLCHGGHVGQRDEPLVACDRQPAQLPVLDLRDARGRRAEGDRRMPANGRLHRRAGTVERHMNWFGPERETETLGAPG